MSRGTHIDLQVVDLLSLYGNESNAIEKAYAIFANVLELDEEGEVLNFRYARKRACDWIRAYCDEGSEVDPPYEEWEEALYLPPR